MLLVVVVSVQRGQRQLKPDPRHRVVVLRALRVAYFFRSDPL